MKVVAFQQKVAEWGKNPRTSGQAAAIATTSKERAAVAPRPQQRPQSRPVVAEIKRIEPEAKIYTIDARSDSGEFICSATAGDKLEISYVSGKWSEWAPGKDASPDAEDVYFRAKCVLIKRNSPESILSELPAGTRTHPFVYDVREDGDYALRINDTPGGCNDNAGSVRYSVRVISGEKAKDAANTQPAPPSKPEPSATGEQSGRFLNQTLTGTQTAVSVTLAKTAQPHVVKEQYIVPEGKELLVEAGATIVFERGASLHCEGTLRMNGSEQAPIVCKGKMPTVGYWSGIRLRSEDAIMDWVQISGAVEAIQINKSPSILNCAICRNEKSGIHVGMNCAGGDARIVNCLIANNGKKGIDCHHGQATLENCTITGNGETGLWVGYSGHVKASACKIEGNKGRGCCFDAGGQGDVHNSSITGNKGFDIEYTGGGASDFRECYWGTSITRMLQQRGDGANLPNIKDGRDTGDGNTVNVAEFLTEPPKDCGATVKF